MESKNLKFRDNKTHKELFKNSHFKSLFAQRKRMFDGYPESAKGLQFSDPVIRLGNAEYSFKTTDCIDTVKCKDKDIELRARYKKNTKNFDVQIEQKFSDEISGLFKYENNSLNAANNLNNFCIGGNLNFSNKQGCIVPFQFNAKYNVLNNVCKTSGILYLDKYVSGLKAALDSKATVPYGAGLSGLLGNSNNNKAANCNGCNYNIGISMDTRLGLTSCSYNDNAVTVAHHKQLPFMKEKKTEACLEVVQPLKGGSQTSYAVAVGMDVDSSHQVKCKLNNDLQLAGCLKKDFNSKFHMLFGCVYDMRDPSSLMTLPNMGVKAVVKF